LFLRCDLCANPLYGPDSYRRCGRGGEANGTAPGDYGGDGLPDLFVARLGEGVQPLLYLNQGSGGRAVGSGVCFYRLQSGGRVLTQSMVLLR
jgi:hypothetical protein